MVKKITKYLKCVVCCALILSLVAPSYAALSASDGSAFVTKAEFDSALADFNARLTTFEAGINSKIDSQVSSYLDRNGIWNGAKQTILPGEKQWFGPSWVIMPDNTTYIQANGNTWIDPNMRFGCFGEELFVKAFSPEAINSTNLLYSTKSGLLCLTFQMKSPNMARAGSRIINGVELNLPGDPDTGANAGTMYAIFTGNVFNNSMPAATTSSHKPWLNYKDFNWQVPILHGGLAASTTLSTVLSSGNHESGFFPVVKSTTPKYAPISSDVASAVVSNRSIGFEIFKGDDVTGEVLIADAFSPTEPMIDGGNYTNGAFYPTQMGSTTVWTMPAKSYSSYAFVSKNDIVRIRNTWTNVRSAYYIVSGQFGSSGYRAYCPWMCKILSASVY